MRGPFAYIHSYKSQRKMHKYLKHHAAGFQQIKHICIDAVALVKTSAYVDFEQVERLLFNIR